jgi:hypothetical protein
MMKAGNNILETEGVWFKNLSDAYITESHLTSNIVVQWITNEKYV